VILADDLGYGDLSCYGSGLATPNLDGMAAEGMRFDQCYSASSVCSPARASILTGRYAVRMGLPYVLFPWEERGIPESETTVAQLLRDAGYATACMGKWHLGHRAQFGPTSRGFDEFFGVPYSNDMEPLPLMRNSDTVESPTSNAMLTKRFTQQAVDFIGRSKERPFFLYLSHCAPHIPIGVSPEFAGRSGMGAYGDAVQEVDWSVGRILAALAEHGLTENTLVIFTSDNGPWYQGSAGRLRGRKGETFEGGMRVPMIARMPGRIPAGSVAPGMATHLDLLPTFTAMAGASLPAQRVDGVDISPMLEGRSEVSIERGVFLLFDYWNLQCALLGNWKLHLARCDQPPWLDVSPDGRTNLLLPRPELYDVVRDPAESSECGLTYPQLVSSIKAQAESLLETFPDTVRDAWRATQSRAARWTPVGAPTGKAKP
jgi:arylsulfatase